MKKEEIASGAVRYFFLTIIIAYGVFVASMTQVSSMNYRQLASVVLNCLLFYFFLVAIYLWLNRLKDWKILILASTVVMGFVVELVARVQS